MNGDYCEPLFWTCEKIATFILPRSDKKISYLSSPPVCIFWRRQKVKTQQPVFGGTSCCARFNLKEKYKHSHLGCFQRQIVNPQAAHGPGADRRTIKIKQRSACILKRNGEKSGSGVGAAGQTERKTFSRRDHFSF